MRILLVDSSRAALDAVARLLEAEHHEVRAFTNEQDALRCLARDPQIDALLTSAELDGTSGFELCHRARRVAGDRRPLHIIVMSPDAERGRLIEALDSGADDFIGKPPVADELYARLRTAARLIGMQRDLIHLASVDSLTGAFNRRAFFLASEGICRAAAETGEPVAAIMLDVDHFKSINDLYGHDVGDNVLKAVAEEIAHVEDAVFGRLGGEEFALVLDQCSLGEAMQVAEGLRTVIADFSFEGPKGPIRLTCSFGVAGLVAGESMDSLLKRADLALYGAKKAGRNRVMLFDQHRETSPSGGVVRSGLQPKIRAAE